MSKVFFITGASRGIGGCIAEAALQAGHMVVATARNLDALQTRYREYGDKVLPLPLDVTDEMAARQAVETAAARFGRIDVLVNNAGYGQLGIFEANSHAAIARQFDTNVFGTFHVTRAVLPVMRAQQSGHVFQLSSIGGIVGFEGASIYCATKFAVEGFAESLAPEVARFGIRVTIVEPGFFRTDFLDASSVRYGDRAVDGYGEALQAVQQSYDAVSHRQAGDPAKLGRVVVQLANMPQPPLRFAAGSDAIRYVADKLNSARAELEAWRGLSASTDIAP